MYYPVAAKVVLENVPEIKLKINLCRIENDMLPKRICAQIRMTEGRKFSSLIRMEKDVFKVAISFSHISVQ